MLKWRTSCLKISMLSFWEQVTYLFNAVDDMREFDVDLFIPEIVLADAGIKCEEKMGEILK